VNRETVIFKKLGLRDFMTKSVLDIGGENHDIKDCGTMKRFFEHYSDVDVAGNPSYKFDLNKEEITKVVDRKYDLIIANQVAEHLTYPDDFLKSLPRIAGEAILIGLPNDYTFDCRLRFLFGKRGLYERYGHKTALSLSGVFGLIKSVEESYASQGFFLDKVAYLFSCSGGRFLPFQVRDFLASFFPNLFSHEVLFLFKKKVVQ